MTRAAFAPDRWAESLFRARVARHLSADWVTRANAIKLCGEAGVKLRCACGDACIVPYRCGARACPSCAKQIAARTTARIANRVAIATESRRIADLWDGKGPRREKRWKLFTGTSRAGDVAARFDHDVLLASIRAVRGAWGPFWRSTPWGARVRVAVEWTTAHGVETRYSRRARRDTAAIMGLEVAPGGMVHLHAAIYGEYVPTDALRALWSAALGSSAFVKIRAMEAATPADFEKALREVLKYVTKWDKAPGGRERRAAAIEYAMRGVRRIDMAGCIRAMPGVDADLRADVAGDACTGCGRADAWSWSSIWAPDKVQANGGFGRVVAALDDAERRKFRRNPLAARVEALRDANAEVLEEVREELREELSEDGASSDAAGAVADSDGNLSRGVE